MVERPFLRVRASPGERYTARRTTSTLRGGQRTQLPTSVRLGSLCERRARDARAIVFERATAAARVLFVAAGSDPGAWPVAGVLRAQDVDVLGRTRDVSGAGARVHRDAAGAAGQAHDGGQDSKRSHARYLAHQSEFARERVCSRMPPMATASERGHSASARAVVSHAAARRSLLETRAAGVEPAPGTGHNLLTFRAGQPVHATCAWRAREHFT